MKTDLDRIPKNYDYLAPDGSEIRLLTRGQDGGLCHCTLPPNTVSQAVKHKSVEEIWHFLSGEGEIWRKSSSRESVMRVQEGVSLLIQKDTDFQFRNTGSAPLRFLIVTMPNWPGPAEAILVTGHW